MIEAGITASLTERLWHLHRFRGPANYEQLIDRKSSIRRSEQRPGHRGPLLGATSTAMAMALIVAKRCRAVICSGRSSALYIPREIEAGLIWKFIYDGENGLIAAIFRWFGAQAPFLLASRAGPSAPSWWSLVRKYFGWHMMIFIAGLQVFRRRLSKRPGWMAPPAGNQLVVKIPLLLPTIGCRCFFSVLGLLQLFDLIIPLTAADPPTRVTRS
jgi:raffinose/stachyose/melibiose transport system permease protein